MVKHAEVDHIREQINQKVDKFIDQIIKKQSSITETESEASSDSALIESPLTNSLVKEKKNMSKIQQLQSAEKALDFAIQPYPVITPKQASKSSILVDSQP